MGRDEGNEIVLDDPLVSRRHALLVPQGAGFGVSDLDSLNGVFINGRPISHVGYLGPGDCLSIGRTSFFTQNGDLLRQEIQPPSLTATGLSFVLKGGKQLISNVSFAIGSGSLVAVIGPSGAGKSTLLRAITGTQPATSGRVIYQGLDLYANFAQLRRLIGVVPQDDVVHRQLTVEQALRYAAELRLPADYSRADREREVTRVVNDLDLTDHRGTPITRLSGGQRKRTSVAMELLAQPDLLLLDEPTSGLDPNLDRSVMQLLRRQADGGRTVMVVTHSTDNLEICDYVLILAPGGYLAYFGRPDGVLPYFAAARYADVFKQLTDDPRMHAQRWEALAPQTAEVPVAPRPGGRGAIGGGKPSRQRYSRQWSTLVRRLVRIIASDRSYALSTLVLPIVIALMALAIPGETGFGPPDLEAPSEPSQVLVIITVGAAFMGMASSIRELIAERPIFLRERTVGLSPLVYLASKVCVLLLLTFVQSGLLIGIVRLVKPGPETALWLPNGTLELWLAAFGTAAASAMLGLFLSALVGSNEQTMPALVVTVMAQLVFCGGLIEITDRGFLEVLAGVFPSRWGFAQAAATMDLTALNPKLAPDDLWEHTMTAWVTSAIALVTISLVSVLGAAIRLHRQKATT
ncbi:MAG: ATP-binding cassette domain-containing protein [Propionibacteriaceae bacterium]|nr:ATP-binding cassette domain-containing protein [Propionibacteriaceae bacterium]